MITHQRVTGVTATDPAKVNGKDWDDPHLYGWGDLLTLGAFTIDFSGGYLFTYIKSPRVSVTRFGAGNYQIYVDVSGLPVPSGTLFEYFVSLSSVPLPIGVGLEYVWIKSLSGDTLTIFLNIRNAGGSTQQDPASSTWSITGLITAAILPPTP